MASAERFALNGFGRCFVVCSGATTACAGGREVSEIMTFKGRSPTTHLTTAQQEFRYHQRLREIRIWLVREAE